MSDINLLPEELRGREEKERASLKGLSGAKKIELRKPTILEKQEKAKARYFWRDFSFQIKQAADNFFQIFLPKSKSRKPDKPVLATEKIKEPEKLVPKPVAIGKEGVIRAYRVEKTKEKPEKEIMPKGISEKIKTSLKFETTAPGEETKKNFWSRIFQWEPQAREQKLEAKKSVKLKEESSFELPKMRLEPRRPEEELRIKSEQERRIREEKEQELKYQQEQEKRKKEENEKRIKEEQEREKIEKEQQEEKTQILELKTGYPLGEKREKIKARPQERQAKEREGKSLFLKELFADIKKFFSGLFKKKVKEGPAVQLAEARVKSRERESREFERQRSEEEKEQKKKQAEELKRQLIEKQEQGKKLKQLRERKIREEKELRERKKKEEEEWLKDQHKQEKRIEKERRRALKEEQLAQKKQEGGKIETGNFLERLKKFFANLFIKKSRLGKQALNQTEGEKKQKKPEAEARVNLVPLEISLASRMKEKLILALLINLGCIVVVALVFLAFLVYPPQTKLEVEFLNERIAMVKKATRELEGTEVQYNNFQSKIAVAKNLFDNHVYWTKFFEALESHTIPEVAYLSFGGDVNGRVYLNAVAKDYYALARQMLVFQRAADFIKTVNIDAASQGKEDPGKSMVSFNISLQVNPDIFRK